jgi:hypothetical protein
MNVMKEIEKFEVKAAAEAFAARFSGDDWAWLVNLPDGKFWNLVEDGDFEGAEIMAECLLANRNMPATWAAAEAQERWEKMHQAAREMVARWARATGRTGGAHKQARQARIRGLMKNGLESAYAARLKAETAPGGDNA